MLQAFADAVILKSNLGAGRGDIIQALRALAEGVVCYHEDIRRLGLPASRADLPPLVKELTERELDVVVAVARSLKNQAIANALGISLET